MEKRVRKSKQCGQKQREERERAGNGISYIKMRSTVLSVEEIKHACRIACADEFVEAHPDGYDRVIDQGGANVSGGQKQRLCIARALLKKPKVLILDDSTSAVDMATDAKIRSAMKNEMPETTKLIIAQRIASVMDSDKIMVLDDGKIVDFGTHDELMERSPIYKEVYDSQTKGGDDNG